MAGPEVVIMWPHTPSRSQWIKSQGSVNTDGGGKVYVYVSPPLAEM